MSKAAEITQVLHAIGRSEMADDDVGVAMGACDSDAALEQTDAVLMHERLENL
jgi:hypothetical protein